MTRLMAAAVVLTTLTGGHSEDGTIQDGARIQAAIDAACRTGGGRVGIGPGWYRIQQPLLIRCSGITLQGAGPSATHLYVPASHEVSEVISIGGGEAIMGTVVEDLEINGGLVHPSERVGIYVDRAIRTMIRDVSIDHVQHAVVMGRPGVAGTSVLRIIGGRFGSWGDGLVVNGQAGLWVTRTHLNGNSPGARTRGVAFVGGFDSAWLTDVAIETHDTGVWVGSSDPNVEIWDLWFSGTFADRVVRAGFELGGVSRVQSVQFSNCWTSAGEYGFVVYQPGPAATSRITITGSHVNAATDSAIWIGGQVNSVSIVGNVLAHGRGRDPIAIRNGTPLATVATAGNVYVEAVAR
jgi:hypothetical protein